jgi:hypothetical protein
MSGKGVSGVVYCNKGGNQRKGLVPEELVEKGEL